MIFTFSVFIIFVFNEGESCRSLSNPNGTQFSVLGKYFCQFFLVPIIAFLWFQIRCYYDGTLIYITLFTFLTYSFLENSKMSKRSFRTRSFSAKFPKYEEIKWSVKWNQVLNFRRILYSQHWRLSWCIPTTSEII